MVLTDARAPLQLRPEPGQRRPSPRPSRITPAHRTRLLLVLAMFASSLAGLHVLIDGIFWWVVTTLAAAVVLGVAGFARSRMRRAGWPSVFALGAGLMFLTASSAPSTGILLVIPTLDTFPELVAAGNRGVASIMAQSIPATPTPGIVMLLVLLTIVMAWFADIFVAVRTPALVALPIGGLLVVPVAVRAEVADPVWFVVTAVLYLALLRVGSRADSRRVVATVGAVALAGAFLAPPLLPDLQPSASGGGTGGFRTGLNPLVSLGDDLRRDSPMRVLSYASDAEGPVYLRLATMEDFTGSRWEPTVPDSMGPDLENLPGPAGLAPDVERVLSAVQVEVGPLASQWAPAPYPASAVSGLEGQFYWHPDTLAVRAESGSVARQTYQVEFWELFPTAEQFVRGGGDPAPEGATELPQLPEIIPATAREATASAATPYDQAFALQRYLRGAPFRYSEQTPVRDGYDGTGIDAIATFLEVKSGYCVHYASAMAVMARSLGIPSRLAVGFTPGSSVIVDGAPRNTVTTDDLHAWPELFIEGVGWMRFEPTPGRGSAPVYDPVSVDDPATPEDESTQVPTAAPAPTSTPTAQAGDLVDDVIGEVVGPTREQLSLGAVVAVLLALASVPALFRAGVRASRIRRMRSGRDAAAAAWEELRDTARDHGWSAPDTESPREFAARLLLSGVEDEGALSAFRASVEAAAFARDPEPLSEHDLRAARRTIAEAAGFSTRALALVLPPSLLYRWKPDSD